MSYATGTASSYENLLAVLATFAAANGWTVLSQTTTELYLKGEGLEGLDEIYCGVKTYEDSVNNRFNWELFGSINWRSDLDIDAQPYSNAFLRRIYAPFWNTDIPYWLFGDASRIILVAKVGTVYTQIYLGFLEPPATTSQYPYPLYIGGAAAASTYNYTTSYNTTFWAGACPSVTDAFCGVLYLPSGGWGSVCNTLSDSSETEPGLRVYAIYESVNGTLLTSLGDEEYLLQPIFIKSQGFGDNYGQLKGVFRVSGYNNSSENIITVDGVNYIVFQDFSRIGYGNYCAIRMV